MCKDNVWTMKLTLQPPKAEIEFETKVSLDMPIELGRGCAEAGMRCVNRDTAVSAAEETVSQGYRGEIK